MPTITTPGYYYTRLATVIAVPADNEKRMLTNGTAGTDYKGALAFAANTLAAGDMIRVTAWGTWKNTDLTQSGTVRVRIYFNDSNPAALNSGLLNDTTSTLSISTSDDVEWFLQADITIRLLGDVPDLHCQGLIQNVKDPNPTNFNRMSAWLSSTIDATDPNYVELTALVADKGEFRLRQCSIERFPNPG